MDESLFIKEDLPLFGASDLPSRTANELSAQQDHIVCRLYILSGELLLCIIVPTRMNESRGEIEVVLLKERPFREDPRVSPFLGVRQIGKAECTKFVAELEKLGVSTKEDCTTNCFDGYSLFHFFRHQRRSMPFP